VLELLVQLDLVLEPAQLAVDLRGGGLGAQLALDAQGLGRARPRAAGRRRSTSWSC